MEGAINTETYSVELPRLSYILRFQFIYSLFVKLAYLFLATLLLLQEVAKYLICTYGSSMCV